MRTSRSCDTTCTSLLAKRFSTKRLFVASKRPKSFSKAKVQDFGLLQADGSTISMSGGKKQDEIVQDVSKVCAAALEKKAWISGSV